VSPDVQNDELDIMRPSIPGSYRDYIQENGLFEGFTLDDTHPGYVQKYDICTVTLPGGMLSEKLYTLRPAESAPGVIAAHFEQWRSATQGLNRAVLKDHWRELNLYLEPASDVRAFTALCVYCNGFIAVDGGAKQAILTELLSDLEFLPVLIDGVQWELMNCIGCVSNYSPDSVVHRFGVGEIFAIEHLVIERAHLSADIFTLGDSNRAKVFVTEKFKRQCERYLIGVAFKEIGVVV